jgi:hypothetical protein
MGEQLRDAENEEARLRVQLAAKDAEVATANAKLADAQRNAEKEWRAC